MVEADIDGGGMSKGGSAVEADDVGFGEDGIATFSGFDAAFGEFGGGVDAVGGLVGFDHVDEIEAGLGLEAWATDPSSDGDGVGGAAAVAGGATVFFVFVGHGYFVGAGAVVVWGFQR